MSSIKAILSENCITSVKEFLNEHPEGFREYELLLHLDALGFFNALDNKTAPSLLLFQKHFLVFHILYSINQELVNDRKGSLQITALQIKKLQYVDAGSQVGEVDPLSSYYLDLSNLESATESNVNNMLSGFWEKYLRNDQRGDALKVLGLNDPVTDKEITVRYRKLVNVHHPDKGGDKDKIQEINEAYALLVKA